MYYHISFCKIIFQKKRKILSILLIRLYGYYKKQKIKNLQKNPAFQLDFYTFSECETIASQGFT